MRLILGSILLPLSFATLHHTRPLARYIHPVHATADSLEFVGDWDGAVQVAHESEQMSGTMALSIAHDSGWRLGMELSMHSHPVRNQIRDFHVDGDEAHFTVDAHDFTCETTAKLAGDALNGSMDCGHAVATFALKRRAK